MPVRLRLTLVVLFALTPLVIGARQGGPTADRPVTYTLSARLDPVEKTLAASGRIRWRNTADTPVAYLRLHLYWNAWRDNHSSWMRGIALAGDDRLAQRAEAERGRIEIASLRRVGGDAGDVDLLPTVSFAAPDDGNLRDRTLATVILDPAVAPGEVVDLDVAWTAYIPRTFARTGVLGSNYVIAHWFPKVGVLTADGWVASQFHALTEFFADFGTYDVSLTVPTGWVVGATGTESGRDDHGDGFTTHRYVATDVHDFAWVADPDYIERLAPFRAEGLPDVDVRLLLRPEHAAQSDRYVAAIHQALGALGRRLGPFPWPNLTVVDPAIIVNARAQGESTWGMEYPTLITAGTNWWNRWADFTLEDLVVHEVTHQYFQSAVATDEVRHAWLDEGITTWLADEILSTAWPRRFVAVDWYLGGLVPWRLPDVPWSRVQLGYFLDAYRREPGWDAPTTPTWRQSPRSAIHTIYLRTPLALETIRRVIGTESMTTAIATFAASGRFRHPTPDEFVATLNAVAGRDLTWLIDATLASADTFDYAVEDVVQREIADEVTESTVLLRRLQPGVFPVAVDITFDDGREIRETWDGVATWHSLTYEGTSPVVRVEVDRDRTLALDVHRTNNSWTAEPRAAEAADRWTRRWIGWMQQVLLTYAFFV